MTTKQWRLILAVPGIALMLFGIFRLLTQIPNEDLILLAVWLGGALVLHDGLFAPIVAGIGATIARVVPPRARRFLQPGLIVGGLITVIALPEIYRQGVQPPSKAVLRQNYSSNLAIALGIVTAVMVLAYLVRVVRDRSAAGSSTARPKPGPGSSAQRPKATNGRPSTDQDSSSE